MNDEVMIGMGYVDSMRIWLLLLLLLPLCWYDNYLLFGTECGCENWL